MTVPISSRIARLVGIAASLMAALAALGYSLGAWHGQTAVAAALLTATGTAAAACVAALVWEYKAQLDRESKETEEQRLRAERVKDTVIAIEADLASDLELVETQFSDDRVKEELARFDERLERTDGHPLPRSVQSTKRLVLAAVERDLTILPETLIRPVLDYYEIDLDIGALIEAFSSGRFDELAPPRQRELLSGYLALGKRGREKARTALAATRAWLADNRQADMRIKQAG